MMKFRSLHFAVNNTVLKHDKIDKPSDNMLENRSESVEMEIIEFEV